MQHFIEAMEGCFLRRLASDFDVKSHHAEYGIRKNTLDRQICHITKLVKECDLRVNSESTAEVLSTLFLLHKELQTGGDWNNEKSVHYATLIDNEFEKLYGYSLKTLFNACDLLNGQEIFDICMERLHNKLNPDDFKRFPSLIEVYCSIINNINEYKVRINPQKVLPISLLLVDDYIPINKSKGLKCCKEVLHYMVPAHFGTGNYHEVIYISLKNAMNEKDLNITKLVLEAMLDLLDIIPNDDKQGKLGELLTITLDEVQMESNFYRKSNLILFLQKIISYYDVNSVKMKKKFNGVIIQSFDLCMNEAVREILFENTMKCLEIWFQYCWCVWKYQEDRKLLSSLLITLYAFNEKEEKFVQMVQNLFVVLVKLCKKGEQQEIMEMLKKSHGIQNETFLKRLDFIINQLQ